MAGLNPSVDLLNDKLRELESNYSLTELDIQSELRKIRKDDDDSNPCDEFRYEVLAFSFIEHDSDNMSGWGTYFGPMATWVNDKGQTIETPDLSLVDKNCIEYWMRRSKECKNPVMRARYAGLVWDFSNRCIQQKPHYSTAIRYCEALISIADHFTSEHAFEVYKKLSRAISIAKSLGNVEIQNHAKRSLIDYEKNNGEDLKPGLWGHSFDILVWDRKANLSADEETEIIQELEARLQRLQEGDPWVCENAAGRLGKYYRRKGDIRNSERVIKVLGKAFESKAKNASAMLAQSWLEHMHQVYVQFNLHVDAQRILVELNNVGQKAIDEMQQFSQKIEITEEQLDEYIEKYITETLSETLERIVIGNIPRRDDLEEQLRELAGIAPLSFLISKKITDKKGRSVAVVGSLESDMDGNIVMQMAQNMEISFIFLTRLLGKAIEKFNITENNLVEHLYQSPVFMDDRKPLLLKGLHAYLNGDYIAAIHFIVPQIEAVVRNLVETSGGPVLKPARSGGFHLCNLDELLRSEQFIKVFGEDVALYCRVVLTDQRGWNIRNDLSHGLLHVDSFSKGVADRLIHILLLLALVRKVKESTK